jgi:hypothetical protein
VSDGPSGPIFTFLIQFEFYPTKQSGFKKMSPPIFLEFDLVFLHNVSIFYFFEIFEFKFQNSVIFKFGPGQSCPISMIFGKIGRILKMYSSPLFHTSTECKLVTATLLFKGMYSLELGNGSPSTSDSSRVYVIQ